MQWCFIEAFPTFSSVEVVLQCVWEQSLDTELGFHGFLRLLRALTPLSTSSVSGLDNPSRVCLRVCLETDLFPFSLLLPPCSKLHSLSWSVWLWLPSHCCLVWIHMAAEVIILKQKMSHCWMKYSTGFIQSASLKKSQRSIVTCRAFFFFFLQINISVVVYSLSSLFQEHWSPVVLEHLEYISAPQPLLWLLCLKCSPDICFVHTCSSWIKYMFWVCVYVCEIFSKIRTLPSSGTIDHLLAFFSLPVTYHLTFSACWNVKLIPLRYIVCFVYCSCYTCNICDT